MKPRYSLSSCSLSPDLQDSNRAPDAGILVKCSQQEGMGLWGFVCFHFHFQKHQLNMRWHRPYWQQWCRHTCTWKENFINSGILLRKNWDQWEMLMGGRYQQKQRKHFQTICIIETEKKKKVALWGREPSFNLGGSGVQCKKMNLAFNFSFASS